MKKEKYVSENRNNASKNYHRIASIVYQITQ